MQVTLGQNHGGWNSDDLMTNNLGRFRLSVNVYNLFDNQQVNAIKTSNKNAPTTTINGVKYQTGYGPLDQLQFNAPRSVQGTIAVKF